jgi:hypothetical protein
VRFIEQSVQRQHPRPSYVAEQQTVVAIYDGINEQVQAVLAASRLDKVYNVPLQEHVFIWGSFAQTTAPFKGWDDVARMVTARWEAGVRVVEEMMRKLDKAKLPRPESIRPRKVFREDDGQSVDIDRLWEGQPYWRGLQRQKVGGPRVISLLVQIGANGYVDSQDLLWRGATALCVAKKLEDAGYRVEILGYDYGLYALASGRHCCQATWVKRSQDKLNIPSLVNALSGWYFRTVNFGSLSLVPDDMPGPGFGSETTITPEILQHLTRGLITPWIIHEVWSQEQAIASVSQLLEQLNQGAKGKVAVMP